ncbi:MAG TPA: hypothetical protein VGN86_15030 [Pyrinomonadaceae bacterium]|nr:hypothetical protein [Pyrinomonadaceae bacterium]
MNTIWNVIKKAFLWSYARNTWQWDVLCVLCLIFIFLTPKTWFANSERTARTVIVGAELINNDKDMSQFEKRVRTITGRPEARVVKVRPRQDNSGRTIAYEVDIH